MSKGNRVETPDGRVLETQDGNGNTTWSRRQEMKNVAGAAAKGAIKGANGVSGDEQAAADAARQAVEDIL